MSGSKPSATRAGVRQGNGRAGGNKGTVWTVSKRGSGVSHFAAYPEEPITPCILARCPPEGIVLDPFAGTATTGVVAPERTRRFVGIELSADYIEIAQHLAHL